MTEPLESEPLILVPVDRLGPAFPSPGSLWTCTAGTRPREVYVSREQLAQPGPIYVDGHEWCPPAWVDPDATTRRITT